MNRSPLGKTDILVSRLGIGSGTTGFSGTNLQCDMTVREFSDLLLYAYDLGINLWDTAFSYRTYPHFREALKSVKREDIVLVSKTSACSWKTAVHEVESTLKELKTGYVDVFLLHGMRNALDFFLRKGALNALIDLKRKGLLRAVGFSCHGIGAMETGSRMEEFDVVMGRLNYDGVCMDSYQEDFLSKVASIPLAVEMAKLLIPKAALPSVSKMIEPHKPDEPLRNQTIKMLQEMHRGGKGILTMKLFGAGKLGHSPQKALAFASSVNYVDSFVIGMTAKKEIEENVLGFMKAQSLTSPL
ncbi:MAG: hypothetical protein COV67_11020 [Nitrospinae bacterium CG11_big_fil_rev_8_21_14_0_20_56_8]|nr:MAG: hypothetical protein COV67_11020 [Nitrospinae bacterium CG11_big_fil_rev_8_21_14_0_20_56_8]